MLLSPETAMLFFELAAPVEQKTALLRALERDWIAYARPSTLNGVNEERERVRNDSEAAERKRSNDRERARVNRATSWLKLREAVFLRDGFRCAYCLVDIEDEPHCDHIIPFSRGGSNDLSNLATACGPCNIAKGDRTPEEWKAAR